ncbi:MAG TPA: COX15/CtaA family protein [Gemmatimonadales bacterium]|jgi:heme A synthase|nr:COX15/CtaA family protein [Gemmatimonadales bacterium]
MTTAYKRLAWAAAGACYALIVLGGVVRITGSGLGCGNHWPLCNGRLLPPLDLPTIIEYGHRLVAAAVTFLVLGLAAVTWRLRRPVKNAGSTKVRDREPYTPSVAGYVALALLALQVTLGAITVKLDLPPWTIILHLGTAMLLFATLLYAARAAPGTPGLRRGLVSTLVPVLAFGTVLLGALTANLGAASACLGFPLCNGHLIPDGNRFQYIHWTHRLLAFALVAVAAARATRSRRAGPRWVLALVLAQVGVAAAMVLGGLPEPLRIAHVAVGAAVWGAAVLAALDAGKNTPRFSPGGV